MYFIKEKRKHKAQMKMTASDTVDFVGHVVPVSLSGSSRGVQHWLLSAAFMVISGRWSKLSLCILLDP